MPKVFISYNSRDREDAFALKGLLEGHDCVVWLDFFDIRPAERLVQEIADNLAQADVVCLLLSPTAVASKWVQHELDQTLAQGHHGRRLVPILLRPCDVPAQLNELVGIDATEGLDSEPVRLRIVRAVCGDERIDGGLLLDAGQRALLADKEQRVAAEKELPSVADDLRQLRQIPIREITFSIDEASFPTDEPVIFELQLTLDPVFSAPMSFYFARYLEGRTWPEEFGFREPPYTEYYFQDRQRVDTRFRWFDRAEELSPVIGADRAEFRLQFSGGEFKPAGALNLPQVLEIPSIQWLRDKGSAFTLVAHYLETRSALRVDLEKTDLDLRVTAYYRDQQANLTLFSSAHTHVQRVILECDALKRTNHAIEREALLGLYQARLRSREAPSGLPKIIQQFRDTRVLPPVESDSDRRILARYLFEQGGLLDFRGEKSLARRYFHAVGDTLVPLYFDQRPTYADARLMYLCCRHNGASVEGGDPEAVKDALNNLDMVTVRLIEVEPENADYQRARAATLVQLASFFASQGDRDKAAAALTDSVEMLRALAKSLPSRARLQDAHDALLDGVKSAVLWEIDSLTPTSIWRAALGAEGQSEVERALEDVRNGPRLPIWVQPAEVEGWPTREVASPMLRYSVRLREGWTTSPQTRSTEMEVTHVYRGNTAADWLIITLMDQANDRGNMRNWVDGNQFLVGFPILDMTLGEPKPKPNLLEWSCLGQFDELTARLGVDESLLYTGLAQVEAQYPLFSRLYILAARRANFAWKVTLCFETACFPGVGEQMVAENDHVRAGATFGYVRFS
jgi:hypothetical protein